MKSTEKIKNDLSTPIYTYYSKISFLGSLLLIFQIIPVGGFLSIIIAFMTGLVEGMALYFILFLVTGFFVFITFWYLRTSKSSYEIFDDRIDFFSFYKPEEREVVKINEIFQARFEDEFKHCIYLYLDKNHKSKIKKIKENRIIIPVESLYFPNDLIIILKFFQTKSIQIYLSTKSNEVNLALDIKNWKEPPFMDHKLIESFLSFFRK